MHVRPKPLDHSQHWCSWVVRSKVAETKSATEYVIDGETDEYCHARGANTVRVQTQKVQKIKSSNFDWQPPGNCYVIHRCRLSALSRVRVTAQLPSFPERPQATTGGPLPSLHNVYNDSRMMLSIKASRDDLSATIPSNISKLVG